MWLYIQKTGELFQDGKLIASGYSGYLDGKNNPAMQEVHEVGPIPVGRYTIGDPVDTFTHGPFVLPLTPDSSNEMFGRSGFLMHGDSITYPGTASRGCIIMSRPTRNMVYESGDKMLRVEAGQ